MGWDPASLTQLLDTRPGCLSEPFAHHFDWFQVEAVSAGTCCPGAYCRAPSAELCQHHQTVCCNLSSSYRVVFDAYGVRATAQGSEKGRPSRLVFVARHCMLEQHVRKDSTAPCAATFWLANG
jgi:hypothetical protein